MSCWCVCVYYYVESGSFYIENVYYGKEAETLAIKEAINKNIELLNEYEEINEEDIAILTDTSKTESQRLKEYINTLDYSDGNYRYDECVFYDVSEVQINLC